MEREKLYIGLAGAGGEREGCGRSAKLVCRVGERLWRARREVVDDAARAGLACRREKEGDWAGPVHTRERKRGREAVPCGEKKEKGKEDSAGRKKEKEKIGMLHESGTGEILRAAESERGTGASQGPAIST